MGCATSGPDEALAHNEVLPNTVVSEVTDELLAMLMGLQVLAVLAPAETSPAREVAQYDTFIARLRP